MEQILGFLFSINLLPILHAAFSFIVIISIIVFIHELGHYSVAKLSGVKVDVFSIGFGKELVGWNDRSGTRWKISWLPLGGYVKMFGDAGPSSKPDAHIESLSDADRKKAFHFKPLHVKAAIVFAGPLANFLLAFVILTGIYVMHGKTVILPVIEQIVEDTPAEEAGLQPQDRIIAVDDTQVETFQDLQRIISINPGIEVMLTIERNNMLQEVLVTPRVHKTKDLFGNETKVGLLGIQAPRAFETQTLSLPMAAVSAVEETYNLSVLMLKAIKQIVTGQRSVQELGGPIKMAKYSGQAVEKGFMVTIWWIVIVSINLGLVNLFPIPILDGGHLLIYAIQAVIRRPVPEKYVENGMRVGLGLILALMIFVILNDLVTI